MIGINHHKTYHDRNSMHKTELCCDTQTASHNVSISCSQRIGRITQHCRLSVILPAKQKTVSVSFSREAGSCPHRLVLGDQFRQWFCLLLIFSFGMWNCVVDYSVFN